MAKFTVQTWKVKLAAETPEHAAQQLAQIIREGQLPAYEVTDKTGQIFKVFLLDTGIKVHKMEE